ncbi:MAG: hypothetical protein LBE92_02495 [Chryseobacterium sp.]|uniref:hypothetical protein n=1 Tax=Chryseobacterium sp. TaxID=1871047 RepID=UPI00281A3E67|nr:hypothetical protein [Chryseobacterium sp.]MDR2234970.1 hypothetical protein [Chryseobacterium sp.]
MSAGTKADGFTVSRSSTTKAEAFGTLHNWDRSLLTSVFNEWRNNGNKPELKKQDNPVAKTNTLDDLPTKDLYKFIL